MSTEYKMWIEASYPRTDNEALLQAELDGFFETAWRDLEREAYINKKDDREYIMWCGVTSLMYREKEEIVLKVKEFLYEVLEIQDREDMQLELKVKVSLIDLETPYDILGDKNL